MMGRTAGALLLLTIVASALAAPVLTPHPPHRQFAGFENAPPMPIRIVDADGRLRAPFVYPLTLVDRLERRYAERRDRPQPLRLFHAGAVAGIDEGAGPWLPLGGDPLGRDVFARLLYGARLSLGVAVAAAAGALVLGMLVGGSAGYFGGRADTLLMLAADLVIILPALYVVLAFRAALPLVLTVPQVFAALALIMALTGWPLAARGVRTIVAAERRQEYAEAAYAAGAGPWRILLSHLLPATSGFLALTAALLLPAFIVLESTMSLVGLGFPVPAASWGTMMREAWEGGALGDAPWLLAPAAALAATVLAVHLVVGTRRSVDADPRPLA